MAGHKVLLFTDKALSDFAQTIPQFFDTTITCGLAELKDQATISEFKVLVFDSVSDAPLDKEGIRSSVLLSEQLGIPLIVLARSKELQDKLDALEIGCDDFIEPEVGSDELRARITKSIFNRIATDQLADRLELANKTAQSALVDNSELGLNIQFLLDVHQCDNLDQLGQLFFTTIERYGLKCSLQLRSENEVKNMEAHGMAKDLESQLLLQLKDADRYVDFGKRTIMNYGRVSVLIKNMPTDDVERYGAIKDNTFSLVQGMHARVVSLDDRYSVLDEREALKALSSEVASVMATLKDSYQKVMREIADEVDKAHELVINRIPALTLVESDERFLEDTMDDCVKNTTRIFNDGLVLDTVMAHMDDSIKRNLDKIELSDAKRKEGEVKPVQQRSAVELF